MAWDASTITSAAPWAALSTKIKNMCGGAGVENWEFIENVPAGTGAGQSGSASFSVDVFRCNGSNTKYDYVSNVNKLNATDTNAAAATTVVFAGVGALSANKVLIAVIANSKATATDDPSSVTLDGANAPTFTKIVSKRGGDATGIIQISVWTALAGASAPTGTNLSVAYPAAPTCVNVCLDEWTGLDIAKAWDGIDASGATKGVVQTTTSSGTTDSTNIALGTLAALIGPKSVVFSCMTHNTNVGTETQPPGWVATAAVINGSTPSINSRCGIKPDNEERTGTWTINGAGTSWATISMEIQRSTTTTALATLNDAGIDFYFGLQIPVPDGAVTSNCGVFEKYNGGSSKVFSSPASNAATNAPVGTGYWRGYGFVNYNTSPNNLALPAFVALATGGFNYWIKMTKNALVVSIKVGATMSANGVMLIDSLVTGPTDAMPLMSLNWSASSGSPISSFTRLPGVTGALAATGWQATCTAWTLPTHSGKTSNAVNAVDLWANAKVFASRVWVSHMAGWSTTTSYTVGLSRGLMKTDFMCVYAGGTVNTGDTMVIDGNTWTAITSNGYVGATNSDNIVLLVRAT